MAEKTTGVDFFAGFVVGALVGAAAALLLAPQSGEETRTMIRDKGIELKDQADEMSVEFQTKVKDAVDEGKTAATTKKEELLSKLDEAQAPSEE